MDGFKLVPGVFPEQDSEMLELFYRLFNVGPKENMLYSIIQSFDVWFKNSQETREKVNTCLANYFYCASLIDDILDFTQRRMGIPTAHLVYGNAKTVCVTNYVLSLNFRNVAASDNLEMLDSYIKLNNYVYAGQGVEIYMRELGICPTEDEFVRLISKKIVGWFEGALNMLQAFSPIKLDSEQFATEIGLFEIVYNDYTNLNTAEFFDSKGYGEDITTGTFNFVLIHAIQSNLQDTEILEIVKEKTSDVVKIKRCLDLIEKRGSFKYVAEYLRTLERKINSCVTKFGKNLELEKTLDYIMADLGKRSFII